MFLPRQARHLKRAGLSAASVTWLEDGGTSTDPSPHQAWVGRCAQAETEASPFRQSPAPATGESVEERLASLMVWVIRPGVWLRDVRRSHQCVMSDAPLHLMLVAIELKKCH